METMSQINPVLLVVVLLLATTEKGISKGKQINTKYHTNLINKYREGNHFELNLEYSIVKDSSADLGLIPRFSRLDPQSRLSEPKLKKNFFAYLSIF